MEKILYQLGTIRYLRNTVNNGRKMGKTIYQLDLKSIHHYLPLLSTLPKTSFFLHSGCIRPHIATSRKFMMVIGGIIRGVWKGEGLWFIFIYLSQWKIHHFFFCEWFPSIVNIPGTWNDFILGGPRISLNPSTRPDGFAPRVLFRTRIYCSVPVFPRGSMFLSGFCTGLIFDV